MKRALLLFTSLICLTLSSASLHAALRYWDSNGPDPGAIGTTPGAPSGLWGNAASILADQWWSADPNGLGPTNAWVDGDTAVFSASTDATMAFDVFVEMSYGPSIGGLIFEEGQVTISGDPITMTNEFECPIICYTNANTETNGIINSDLSGTWAS